MRDGRAGRVCRGQEVGDGVWALVAAVLPRAAQLQVRRGQASAGGDARFRCAARGGLRAAGLQAARVTRASARRAARGQVTAGGDVLVVSGIGAKGTSWMTLSGGKGLGSDGAQRLADVLQKAAPPMLAVMDLGCFSMSMGGGARTES